MRVRAREARFVVCEEAADVEVVRLEVGDVVVSHSAVKTHHLHPFHPPPLASQTPPTPLKIQHGGEGTKRDLDDFSALWLPLSLPLGCARGRCAALFAGFYVWSPRTAKGILVNQKRKRGFGQPEWPKGFGLNEWRGWRSRPSEVCDRGEPRGKPS